MATEQKTNTVNTFENGMNTDIHPMRIDNKTLRYAKNIDFITAGAGDQLILQKRDGNEVKLSLKTNYSPVAVAESNNVLYIISYNHASSIGEVGTYPSPDYSGGSNEMIDAYSPLMNYHDGSASFEDENFNSPFSTRLLNFSLDGFVDIRVQPSYDGSINLVFTDDINPVRMINSRFAVDESGKYAELIQRRTGDSTNSYSDIYFNHLELIPRTSSVAKLQFDGVIEGGKLTPGGYRYFFRYIDSDGATTDIIEESRLVSIHVGNSPETAFGQDAAKISDKSVKFSLSNLDGAYFGIKVFYTISNGEAQAVTEAFEIDTPFKILPDSTCFITHTGYESISEHNKDEISVSYSPIRNCKSITTTNDRLLLANTESTYAVENIMEDIASQLLIEEDIFHVYNSTVPGLEVTGANGELNYANSEFEYGNTGYWKGETYELGIVFTTPTGVTPVYPCQGLDRLDDTFTNNLIEYPGTLKTPGDPDIFGNNGVNARGVYRTASNGELYSSSGNVIDFKGTKLQVDISPLMVEVTVLPNNYLSTEEVSYSATSGGWKVVYDPDSKQYYLWGTVTNSFTGFVVGDLNDGVFNPNSVPTPSRTINFGYVTITTDGLVKDNGLQIGDKVGKIFGPPIDIKNIATGFYFVRRKRIKDKVMEGVMLPVAAFPRSSRYGILEEFGYPGNWLGCGTSTAGNPVVVAPTPSLCFPFGSDAIHQEDDGDIFSSLISPSGVPVVTASTTTINHADPQYDGIPVQDRVVDIELTYVPVSLGNIIIEGVNLTTTALTNGIPIEALDSNTNIVTVKLENFDFTYGFIKAGKGIQTLQSPADLNKIGGSGDFIIRAPVKDYESLKSWALYSPDVECAPAYHASKFKNSSLGINIHADNVEGNIQYLTNPDSINELLPFSTYLSSSLFLNNATADTVDAKADYIEDGAITTAEQGFTGVVDRSLYIWYRKSLGDPNLTYNIAQKAVQGDSDIIENTNNDNPFRHVNFRHGMGGMHAENYYTNTSRRPGVSVKYGKYIGLKAPNADVTFGNTALGRLNVSESLETGERPDNENRNNNFETSLKTMSGQMTFEDHFGAYCQVFSSTAGTHLDTTNWESRYDDDGDTEYFAISRRYAFEEFELGLDPNLPLFGGDCYLGQSWKQVWFPKGIDEAPQASDLTAYTEGRRNLGMLGYGYAIAVPAQSNYNFHLRVPEEGEAGEYAVFGKERTFVPIKSALGCRGNRQFDTSKYNFGYSDQDVSDNKVFKLADTAPFYKSLFPNRIYASDASRENEFVNGFTQFSGLNFKDYNTELGPISRLITLKDKAYAVFQGGVGTIGINERTQVSQDTGGVFIDNADVLAQKANIISSSYGSSHPNSVITSINFIYGVDISKRKIWRTSGGPIELISNTRIQSLLGEILDEINTFINETPATSADRWIDVYTTFDAYKGDIVFSFYGKDRTQYDNNHAIYRTLVFNENDGLNTWVCESDDHRKFAFSTRESRIAFVPTIGVEDVMYGYDNAATFSGNNIFRDTQYDAEIKFSVVNDPMVQKLYENMWVVGDNSLPTYLDYYSGYSNKVFGVSNNQMLAPYTNVAYQMRNGVTAVLANATAGSKILTLNVSPDIPPPGRTDVLRTGDNISLLDPTGFYIYYTVISVNGLNIYVDKPALVTQSNYNLFYGYKTHMRLTDSAIEDGYSKIICQATNGTNNYDRKLRGKWVVTGMTFEGEDQIYINNVVTTYTKSFS